jgi:O-antigen ligase
VAVALLLSTFLALRLSELIPGIQYIRPVLVSTAVSVVYLWSKTRVDVMSRTLRDGMTSLMLAYILIAVVGVPFALYRSSALGGISGLVFGGILTLAICLVPPTMQALEAFTRIIVLLALTVTAVWVLQGAQIAGTRMTSSGSYDPNDLAAMICLFLPLALAMIFRGTWNWRVVGAVASAVFLFTIIRTSSRGGLVASGAIALTFLFTLKPSQSLRMIALGIPLLAGVWAIAPADFRERAMSLESVNSDYNVTYETGRIAIWKRGWSHFLDRPILGTGIGGFSVAEGNYFQSINKIAAYYTAHNTYIQAYVEMGIFGGSVLVFMIGKAVNGARQMSRRTVRGRANPLYRPEYFAALVGYFTAAFFLSHAYAFLLFLALGIGILVRNVHREGIRQLTLKQPPPIR